MFFTSLANSLPRRASTTAFLCLVVAHLEWPDMRWCLPFGACGTSRLTGRRLRQHADEQCVEPVVAGDLGVERRGEQVRLPDRDDPTHLVPGGDRGDDRDVPAHLLHPGRPDEHRVERLRAVVAVLLAELDVQLRLERVDLAAEGVAP